MQRMATQLTGQKHSEFSETTTENVYFFSHHLSVQPAEHTETLP